MKPCKEHDPVSDALASAHAVVNANHSRTRDQLLERLSVEKLSRDIMPKGRGVRNRVIWGVCLSLAASALVLALWLPGSTGPTAAMDQMAQALGHVTSYSFRLESVYESRGDLGRTVRQVTIGSWRTDPVGLYADIRVVEVMGTNADAPDAPKLLVHLEELHQAGQAGLMVDHLAKEYWWIHEGVDANTVGDPHVLIYLVRQRRGRWLRDLGEKTIDGQVVSGLEVQFDNVRRESELGSAGQVPDDDANWVWGDVAVEVWVDPETHLPVEFRCSRLHDDDSESHYVFSHLEWNAPFSANTVVPEGYEERETSE